MTDSDTSSAAVPWPLMPADLAAVCHTVLRLSDNIAAQKCESLFSIDTANEIQDLGIRRDGHFAFSSGYHSTTYFSFGVLDVAPTGGAVATRMAHRFLTLLDSGSIEFDYIVTHGLPMAKIAARVAAILTERSREVATLHALGDRPCHFLGRRRELVNKRVVLVLDVVHTGTVLERLVKLIEKDGGALVAILCIVDLQQYQGFYRRKLMALVRDSVVAHRPSQCPQCARALPCHSIDNDRALPASTLKAQRTLENIEDKLDAVIGGAEEFWHHACDARAIRKHRVVQGIHITPAIDVSSLLLSNSAREWVEKKSTVFLEEIRAQGPWVIVTLPGPRDRTATLVRFVRDILGVDAKSWPTATLRRNERHQLTGDVPTRWPRRALVVDVGIGSGQSLQAASRLLASLGLTTCAAYAVIDRTNAVTRAAVERAFNGHVFTVVHVPFPVYTVSDPAECPACWKSVVKNQLNIGEDDAVAEYLRPHKGMFARFAATPKTPRHSSAPALFESVDLREFSSLLFAICAYNSGWHERDTDFLLHCVSSPNIPVRDKRAVIDLLPREALADKKVSDSLYAVARNNVPISLLDSACNALSRSGVYTWFDESWIVEHKGIFRNGPAPEARPRWLFLAFALLQAAQHGEATRARVRNVVFRARQRFQQDPVLDKELERLDQILSKAFNSDDGP